MIIKEKFKNDIIKINYNIEYIRGGSINIASGIKTTIREVAMTSKKVFKIPSNPKFATMEDRNWDLRDWYGNANQALLKMGSQVHSHIQL